MADLIHEYSARITNEDGTIYIVRASGEERSDGTWTGWLEFHPTDGGGPTLTKDGARNVTAEPRDHGILGVRVGANLL